MLLFICGPFSGARRRRSVFTCGYPPSGGCFDDGHCCGQRLIRRWDADSGGCGGAGGVQSPGHLDVQGRRGARGLRRDDPGGADDCGAALPSNEYRPSGAGSAALQRQVAGVEGVGDEWPHPGDPRRRRLLVGGLSVGDQPPGARLYRALIARCRRRCGYPRRRYRCGRGRSEPRRGRRGRRR